MAASTATGQTIDVVTPAAGESVTEGTILEWRVKAGDFIKRDDTIVEISTDKVDVELPSPASGIVSELLVEEGDTVTVGQVIARIVQREEGESGPSPASADSAEGAGKSESQAADGSGAIPDGVRVSPVAARAAAAEGVNLASVSGSGPAGRIVKADVLDAAAGNGAKTSVTAASATAPSGAEQMKGGAAALARYMDQSLSIPTATSFRTLAVTALDARRRELKAGGRKVSFTHLIAYAIARAAADMPVMAEHFAAIDGRPHRVRDGQVNLGLAVDVEKKDGSLATRLVVPVISGNLPLRPLPGGLRRARRRRARTP